MNEPIAVPAPSVAPRRVMLLVKSVHIAHMAGFYLSQGRWHKIHQDNPAPAGAPVVAEKPASGHTRMTSDMWAQVYAHADNSNKATFTKKLDKLKEAFEAGDEKAILAGSYPNDTTNKKVVKVANYLLGLMGSEHTVHAGLKQGTHHTLTGEVRPAQPVEAPASVVEPVAVAPEPIVEAPVAEPVTEVVVEPVAAAEAPATTLAIPAFEEGKNTTGVVDYYKEVAEHVQAMAAEGNLEGLQTLKENGLKPNKTGKVGNTWKGKTENSKMLLAMHGNAVAQLGGAELSAPVPELVEEPKATTADHSQWLEKIENAPTDATADMYANLYLHHAGKTPETEADVAAAKVKMQTNLAAPAPVVHTFTNKNAPDLEAHIKQTSDGKWSANIYDKEQATYMPNIGVYGTEAEAVGVFGDAWIKPGAVDDGKPSKPTTGSAHWNEVNDLIEAAMHTGNLADLQVKVDTTTGLQSPSAVMTHEYAKSSFDYVAKKTKDSMGAAILSASSASEAQQMGFDYLAQVGTTPETVGHVVEALEVSGYDQAAAGFQNAKDTAAAIKSANGPQEGDTKQGADGMLVLKDGHWVKQDQGQPQPEATAAPADVHPIDAVPMPDLSNLMQPLKAEASLDLLKQQIKDHGVSALKGITKKMKSSGKVITYLTAATTGKPYKIAGYDGNGQSHDAIYHYVEALKEAAGKSPAKAKAKPAAPAAAPKAVEPAHPSMDDWKQIGPQGGSNPGGKFIDPDGVEWYCKFPGDENMAKSEVLAAKLYEAAGISAQDAKLVTKDGKIGIASKWADVSKGSPAALAKAKGAKAGFAVDAWLANHDVVGLGFDNLQLDATGNAMRVDAGGSLEYRAQGAKKEFSDTVTEIDTMRDKSINDKSAAVFGKMTKADITASVTNVLKVSSAQIYALVNTYGPGTADDKAKLAATLIARKADLLAKYPKAKKEKKIVFDPAKVSAPPSFTNWGGSGNSGPSSKEFINQANEKAVQSIYAAAQTGNPESVKGLSVDTFNKATGEVTGAAPVLDHPSQHVKGYAQQALNEIHQQLNPPKVFRFDGGHPLHSLNAAYPSLSNAKHGDTVEKAGKFLVLGAPGVVDMAALGLTPTTWASGKMTQETFSPVAKAIISAMPVTQKEAIRAYTGSDYKKMNSSLWGGNPSGAAKAAAEALDTLGHEIPPGTVLSRKLTVSGVGLDQILASTGKVLQEPAIMSTAIRPSSWSGNVQLKMHVGPGVKGLWVGIGSTGPHSALSLNATEDELILPPNTRILILSVKKASGSDADGFGGGSNHVIEAVILPSEQPTK